MVGRSLEVRKETSMLKKGFILFCAVIVSVCFFLLSGTTYAGDNMSKKKLAAQLTKEIEKVRAGGTATIRDNAAQRLAELTRGVDPNKLDDKTITDLVSLLDLPDGHYWVAVCLGNVGPRASAAVPKLQELLAKEDCLQVSKSAAWAIRSALTRMGVTPPPPPNCDVTKEQK